MQTEEEKIKRCIQYLNQELSEEQGISFEIDMLFDQELNKLYTRYHKIWGNYPTNSEVLASSYQKKRFALSFSKPYLYVASIAVFMVVGLLFLFSYSSSATTSETVLKQTFTNYTPVNKRIRLEDGSLVVLRPDTEITTYFNDDKRLLCLEGEAYFEVAHEAQRKFIVRHLDFDVEVLGTVFSVNTNTRTKEIALISGKVVAKLNNGTTIELAPNEKLLWKPKVGELKKTKLEVSTQLNWLSDVDLTFNQDPLIDALDKIERYYQCTIIVEDQALKKLKVTGSFTHLSLEELLTSLSFITHTSIQTNPNNVYKLTPHDFK
ncbi:FecR family protein [Myroides pelagicus]|uniref:DUF4974 domain-containing protein n=1 Tax=Myroides pelagicus TaxID=270914 RepID=A0A7K1GNF6_9FLAO|nr:FecR domain-containing protein [Myroides pelagicus]MEC4114248.1 FecR domain-containing protein [Myroides pelagicus]MTH30417.1 DUF4974 domain-containing protein [Myroides pelagicus]